MDPHPGDVTTSTVEGPDQAQQDSHEDGVGSDTSANANVYPTPVNYEVLVHTFQAQLNNMLLDQARMNVQLAELMRTMQDWSREHERIVQLLRRIQEIMDPEFAPGMPLHGFRAP
ncbi:unnamed protein product [Symbiodinium sp. CCMP2592]|nr:unnamed protein product [Symbiodinium sp. CCMP2592]